VTGDHAIQILIDEKNDGSQYVCFHRMSRGWEPKNIRAFASKESQYKDS
jgi:hypothetical protein